MYILFKKVQYFIFILISFCEISLCKWNVIIAVTAKNGMYNCTLPWIPFFALLFGYQCKAMLSFCFKLKCHCIVLNCNLKFSSSSNHAYVLSHIVIVNSHHKNSTPPFPSSSSHHESIHKYIPSILLSYPKYIKLIEKDDWNCH